MEELEGVAAARPYGCFFTIHEVSRLLGIRSLPRWVSLGSKGKVPSKSVERALFGSGVSPAMEARVDEAMQVAWKDLVVSVAGLGDADVAAVDNASPDLSVLSEAVMAFALSPQGQITWVVEPDELDDPESLRRAFPYLMKVNLSVLAGWDAACRLCNDEVPIALFLELMPELVDGELKLPLWRWFHNLREVVGKKDVGFSGEFSEYIGVNRSQPERWMNARDVGELPNLCHFKKFPVVLKNESNLSKLHISAISMQGLMARGLHAMFLAAMNRYGLSEQELLDFRPWYKAQFWAWREYFQQFEAGRGEIGQAPLWRACP